MGFFWDFFAMFWTNFFGGDYLDTKEWNSKCLLSWHSFRKKPKTKTFEIPELSGQELIKMHFFAHSAIEDLLWLMVIIGDSRCPSCFDESLCFNF